MTETSNENTLRAAQHVERNPELVGQIREGMNVRTSDGETIGSVVRVWQCTDPGEATLSEIIQNERRTYQEALQMQAGTFVEVSPRSGDNLYIPWQGIRDIDGECLCLEVDAPSVRESAWRSRPAWATG